MLPLAWSLLNIPLSVIFLYAWLKAAHMLWRLKPWLAVFFVIGSLGSRGWSASSGQPSAAGSVPSTTLSATPPSQPATQVSQVIRENFSQNITLYGFYHRDSAGLRLDTATTHLNGLVLGFKWVPGRVILTDDVVRKRVCYTAYGDLHWSLLGMNVFTQTGQTLKGDIVLPKPSVSLSSM